MNLPYYLINLLHDVQSVYNMWSGGVEVLNKTALVDSELWILFDQILPAGKKNLT